MKHNTLYSLYAAPIQMWSELAFKTGEMMLTSAQVIGHRTNRMAFSGPTPNASDRRELSLMSAEKLSAGAESAQAMALSMIGMTQQFWALALKQLLTGTAATLSLASSRTAAQSQARQAAAVRDTVANAAAATSQLSHSATRIVAKGLRPIHSRVKGNARRLAKR